MSGYPNNWDPQPGTTKNLNGIFLAHLVDQHMQS